MDTIPTGTHPPHNLTRISHNQGVVGDRFCHHCAGTHESIAPYCDATDNRAVGAQSRTPPYACGTQILHAPDLTTWVDYISKHHGWTTKHVVLESHPFIDGDVVLDLYSIADTDIWSDHHVLANTTIFPDQRILQNMGHVPDCCSLTDLYILVNEG